MKKILLILLVSIFLFSFTSAAIDNLGTFKQYSDVPLIQICNDCTYNNITYLQKSDGSILNINVQMDKDDTFYNWTLNGTDSNLLGEYIVNGFGNPGGVKTIWNYKFEVTSSGDVEKSFLLNPIFIFLTIFAFVFVGLGISLKIPSLGFIGSVLLVLAGMYTMIYGFGGTTNLYTRGVAIALLGLGFILIISSVYEWLVDEEE